LHVALHGEPLAHSQPRELRWIVGYAGYRIHHDGSLTSVVNADQFELPISAIGLAAE